MSDQSETLVRKHYPPEFKSEAVKLVLQQGYTCKQAGIQLGVPKKTLANWVRPHRKQERSEQIAAGLRTDDPQSLKARIAELEKQLRQTEMEREILKKATAYFAQKSL
jgi:transposase